MRVAVFRRIVTQKLKIDDQLKKQRGNFSGRSPKDLENVFGISFRDLSTTKELDLGESSLDRLSQSTQEFLLNAFHRYSLTFPQGQSLQREFDSFKGNEKNMQSMIDYFIRTLVMCSYEDGITVSLNENIVMDCGINKGNHDLVLFRGNLPIVILRYAKKREDVRGSALEQAFCNNIFEVYTEYWKNPVWPLYGCVSDLNSWIFLKYDGSEFYRSSRVYKLALHNTAILSLGNKFLNIIDTKVA